MAEIAGKTKSGRWLAGWSLLLLLILLPGMAPAQESPLATGQLKVRGVGLRIEPAEQSVPLNTSTLVNTVFSADTATFPPGMVVRGRLSGPWLKEPITLTTLPNQPFTIPPFPVKGQYLLEDIRLEKDDRVLVKAVPDRAVIDVQDLVITSVETRPLTLEEIREKGIVVTQENFTVWNFTVGFIVESEIKYFSLPYIYGSKGIEFLNPESVPSQNPLFPGTVGGQQSCVVPLDFEITLPGVDSERLAPETHRIAGLLLFNNDVAFLNQFFSVMFIVSNRAPAGSPIALKDVQASITLPQALREAQTNPPHIVGTPIPVRCPGPDGKLGTADDLEIILATFSGLGEFLVEGLRQGMHTVNVDFTGTLAGLPGGDLPIKGTASGAVTVRNPEFSVTYAHPRVVRKGEEYDLFVTLTNTSKVTANLLSLVLPKTRLIGCDLLSQERHEFETIASGESQTVKFRLLSKVTGQVTASAFDAEGQIHGTIVLTVGVGEQGIPLSPDTLVLPNHAYRLPTDLLECAMLLLGEAYSIATAPAGTLPPSLPVVSRTAVVARVIDLAEAGQRLFYGEAETIALEGLTLDWLGNREAHASFDQLRRLTGKGKRFARAFADIVDQRLESGPLVDYQFSFGQTHAYRSPFLSVALSPWGMEEVCRLKIVDFYQNELQWSASAPVRQVPYGEIFRLVENRSKPVDWALVGRFDPNGYRVEVQGLKTGTYDLALIVPDANGGFRQVLFADVACNAASRAWIEIKSTSTQFELSLDANGDGLAESTLAGSVQMIPKPPLHLIGAVQDCEIHKYGHAVGLLFNRYVDESSAKTLANYSIPDFNVYSAFPQASRRLVVLGLDNSISPFAESRVRVTGVKDSVGGPLDSDPTEAVIRATIQTPGGIVTGRALTAAGLPVANAPVLLTETEDTSGSGYLHTQSSCLTDADGNYRFNYVRILPDPFSITVFNPITKKTESVNSYVLANGQRLQIDIVFTGRGTVRGTVVGSDNVTPIPHAYVTATTNLSGASSVFSTDQEAFYVWTDAEGRFAIENVPLGSVSLSAVKDNVIGFSQAGLDQPDQVVETRIVIYPVTRGKIVGRVLQNDGVTPVPNTLVYRIPPTAALPASAQVYDKTRTDDYGNFTFLDVPVGDVGVLAVDPLTGKYSAYAKATLYENPPLELTLILPGSGSISGRVQEEDGTPVPGATVYIEHTPFYCLSGPDGTFQWNEVPIGIYTVLAVRATPYQSTSTRTQVLSAGDAAGALLIFPRPLGSGAISGRVFRTNGSAFPYAQVILLSSSCFAKKTMRTDVNGNFSFADIPVGSYKLVSANGTDGAAAAVSVRFNGEHAAVDLHYIGTGRIRVRTLASDGQTGVMAKVELHYQRVSIIEGNECGIVGDEMIASSDESGEVTFKDVLLREFEVSAWSPFYPVKISQKGIIPSVDGEAVVELVMLPTSEVHVRVLSPDSTPQNEIPVPYPAIRFNSGSSGFPQVNVTGDELGAYLLKLVPPGYFRVFGTDTTHGYKGWSSGNVESGQTLEFQLKLRGLGRVTGRVVRPGGLPVADAQVKLRMLDFMEEGTLSTTADENGEFTFYRVLEGRFIVEATDPQPPGILGGRTDGELTGNGSEIQVEVLVEASGTITGHVIDGQKPASSAQVVIYRLGHSAPIGFCLTDAQGAFLFLHVPSGNIHFEVYHSATGRRAVADARLQGEGDSVNVEIPLECRGDVSGTFFDHSGTQSMANAKIELRNGNGSVLISQSVTDDAGRFSFQEVGQGDFILRALDETTGIRGEAKGRIEYEDQSLSIDILGFGTGTVLGRVLHADGSTPEANAKVEIWAGQKHAQAIAKEDGSFAFLYVPLGSVTLKAQQQIGRDSGSAAGALAFHGQELDLPVIFNGLGTVSGQVRSASGTPVGHVNVTLNMTYSHEQFILPADEEGHFTFPQVPKGAFSLSTRDANGLGGAANGSIDADGQTVTLDLTLQAAGTVRGRLLASDGTTPAADAAITLFNPTGTLYYAATGEDGAFLFPTVKVGDYTLLAEGFDHSGRFRIPVSLASQGQVAEVGDIVLDAQIPAVVSVFPSPGTQNIPLDTVITITFSEAMDPARLGQGIALHAGSYPWSHPSTLSSDKKTLVLTPVPALPSLALCTLDLAGTIEDLAGNRIASSLSFSFTTRDGIPPQVSSIQPANASAFLPLDTTIGVRFSEAIDPASLNSATFSLLKGNTPVAGNLSLSSDQTMATFTPAALDPDAAYTVRIASIQDPAGNPMASVFTSTFTTVDTILPTFTLQPPPVGIHLVEGTSQWVTVRDASSDIIKIYYYIDGTLATTANFPTFSFTFTVPAHSPEKTSFLVEAVAQDRAGNLSQKRSLQLFIRQDLPPVVSITGPNDVIVLPGQPLSWRVPCYDDVLVTLLRFRIQGGGVDHLEQRQNPAGTSQVIHFMLWTVPGNVAPGAVLTVTAEAIDSTGKTTITAPLQIQAANEVSPPSVAITSPAPASRWKYDQAIPIAASAADDFGIKEVRFFVDNQLLATDTTAPYEAQWTVPPYPEDTAVHIRAEAEDWSGKTATAEVEAIGEKLVDATAPQVTISTPAPGSLVFPGENLSILATAIDDNGVSRVEFLVNGQPLSEDTTAPYEAAYAVPLDLADNATITFTARATDVDGKTGQASVQVVVQSGTILAGGTTIAENDLSYDNRTIVIRSGTVTIDGSHAFANLLVKETGVLTHSPATTSRTYAMRLTVSGSVCVGPGARIDAMGKGYLGGRQGGNTSDSGRTLGNALGSGLANGGSYGGFGGANAAYNYAYPINGLYGDMADPNEAGSGGACAGTYYGANGGGILRLTADCMAIDGMVAADGAVNGTGGSGGSIRLESRLFSGSGTVRANGGNTNNAGGGGGRVALHYHDMGAFVGKITAYGGGESSSSNTRVNGSPGTVYLKKSGEAPEWIFDNRGIVNGINMKSFSALPAPAVFETLTAASLTDDEAAFLPNALAGLRLIPDIAHPERAFTIVSNDQKTITIDPSEGDLTQAVDMNTRIYGTKLVFPGHLRIRNADVMAPIVMDVSHLTLENNGVLRHPLSTPQYTSYLELTVAGKLSVDATSAIDATGLGYLGGRAADPATDFGRTLGNVPGSSQYNGGSHGGLGGKYNATAGSVNAGYGSIFDPRDPGSGGGGGGSANYFGGSGGGVIRIACDELELNGMVQANGGTGSNGNYGAGSGGSIRIDTRLVSGSGAVQAIGGDANQYGASGGGGRVALYYGEGGGDILSHIRAWGGLSSYVPQPYKFGTAGTAFVRRAGTEGDILVSNRNSTTANSSLLLCPGPGTVTGLAAHCLTDAAASFVPGSLAGMKLLFPDGSGNLYTIIANTRTEIFTLETEDDLTTDAVVGDTYELRIASAIAIDGARLEMNGPLSLPGLDLNNATLTLNGRLDIDGNASLQNNSVIDHSPATATATCFLDLRVKNRLLIDSTSKIDATGLGYLGGRLGDNASDFGRTLGNAQGSGTDNGGSYGGMGGRIQANNALNSIYGSFSDPADPGSGCGATSAASSGSGGGVIRIVCDELVLDGKVLSLGETRNVNSGSGGSIRIDCRILSGGGEIRADGFSKTSTYNRGGGGGRVALYAETLSGFDLAKISAYGAKYGDGIAYPAYQGGAGTLYLKIGSDDPQLVVDNRGVPHPAPLLFPDVKPSTVTSFSEKTLTDTSAAFTPNSLKGMKLAIRFDEGESFFDIVANTNHSISVENDLPADTVNRPYRGIVKIYGGLKIANSRAEIPRYAEMNSLSVTSNAVLTHPGATVTSTSFLDLSVSGKVTIDATSRIDVSGRGYLGGLKGDNTSDYGRTLGNLLGSGPNSGGSHGGLGGKSGTHPVNAAYGSIYDPGDPGSGGGRGTYAAGNGGGVVRIRADEIQIDGILAANGEEGASPTSYLDGGSGGSIRIDSRLITGIGAIRATGSPYSYPGSGGGRIALYFESMAGFTGSLSARGTQSGSLTGNYPQNGAAGTIYLKASGQPLGDLLVDNLGLNTVGNSTPLPSIGKSYSTGLGSDWLENAAALWPANAFAGMRLNPYESRDVTFPILRNETTRIHCDVGGDALTEYAAPGDPYIGEHHLFNLTVQGKARVFTLDRFRITGTVTVEAGSVLDSENIQR